MLRSVCTVDASLPRPLRHWDNAFGAP